MTLSRIFKNAVVVTLAYTAAASASASVSPLPFLKEGFYTRVSGPKDLCVDGEVRYKKLERILSVNDYLKVVVATRARNAPDATQPGCRQIEDYKVIRQADHTELSQLRGQTCANTAKNLMSQRTVKIYSGRIEVKDVQTGGPAKTCVFKFDSPVSQ